MATLVNTHFTNKQQPTIDAPWLNMVNVFVNGAQAVDGSGANAVTFAQPYTGAGVQSVGKKLRQVVNFLDFYANGVGGVLVDPTGVVDSTLGIQAALNSGADVVMGGPGTFKITTEPVIPVDVSFCCSGISSTNFAQTTLNAGGFKTASGNRAWRAIGGFTVTGTGVGAATSVGVASGNASLTNLDDFCWTYDIEAVGFGVGVSGFNPVECFFRNIHCHGNDIGFQHVGSALPGSNAFNALDFIECYDNRVNYFCDLGDENQVRRLYVWSNSGTTTLHDIWVRDSSLNHYTDWHVEPLPGSVQTGAEVLFESTAGNIHGSMIGNKVDHCGWWFNGGTVDKLQIGTAGGGQPVYSTEVANCDWMPATTFHVNLLNDQATKITSPRLRSGTFNPIGPRNIQVSNPNAATNGSYVGSYWELSSGTWTPTLFTATPASLGTLTAALNGVRWARSGGIVRFGCDVTLSAKTGATGIVTVRGLEGITPDNGATVFAPKAVGKAIPISCLIVGLATSYPVVAYLDTTTMFIQFYNPAVTALLTDTSFANGTQITLSGEFEVV